MKNYTLVWKERSFSLYFFGEITLNDLIAANNELTANPRLDSIDHYYMDFCNVDTLKLTEPELELYAKYDSAMPKFLRRSMIRGAFRVSTSAMKEQLSHFLKVGHRAWPRKVFISCIIAETWVQDGCALRQRLRPQHSASRPAIA